MVYSKESYKIIETCTQWNHDMIFDIAVPDVAMVQFKVLDKDFHNEDFIGQVCIPFNSLQQVIFVTSRVDNEADTVIHDTALGVAGLSTRDAAIRIWQSIGASLSLRPRRHPVASRIRFFLIHKRLASCSSSSYTALNVLETTFLELSHTLTTLHYLPHVTSTCYISTVI